MFIYSVLYAWIIQNNFVNDSSAKYGAMEDVSKRYFNTNFISVFYSTVNEKESKHGLLNTVKILSDLSLWTLQIYNKEVKANSLLDIKTEVMVLLFEGKHSEQMVFSRLKAFRNNYSWSARSKIIIIVEGEDEDYEVYMRSMWRLCKSIYLVFWMLSNNSFYTWEPYRKKECDILKTIKQSSVDQLFKEVDLRNLNKCPLTATTSFIPPFVLRINNYTKKYDRGVESKIMEIIAEGLNSDLRYVEIPSTENIWVWKSRDGKITGGMGMLDRQEAEISFAGISLNYERFQLAEPLTSHIQEDIMWFVPTPPQGNPIQSLYKIFNALTWIMVYAIVVIITILMYYQEGNVSLGECVMNATLAFLNMPSTSSSKFLPMLLYFAAVHIATAYQAMLLFYLVKDVTDKPIETLQEAVDANLFAFMAPSLRIYFNVTEHHLWNKILRPGRYLLSIELVDHIFDIVANKSSIALYPKSTTMYAINKIFVDGNQGPKVLTLKERLTVLTVAFFVPKGHPLKPVLDLRMNQVISGGFVNYWMERYLSKAYWAKSNNLRAEEQREPLTMSNLQSIFFLYLVLSAISIWVFMIEIGYYSHTQKKKVRNQVGRLKASI